MENTAISTAPPPAGIRAKNYNRTLGIFRNRRVTRALATLDPVRDHVEIVRLLGCYEFPYDTVRSLELALFRTFAGPDGSGLLDRTGEFERHGQKRYDDTAVLISEFLVDGYDGPVGQRAIAQMNRIHGAYRIPNDTFLFVLSTFVFDPIDWIARYGWRPMTRGEQVALFEFWRQVGFRMGLTDLPDDIDALRAWAEDYQDRHFHYADTNRRVADATVRIVQGWFPRPLRFAVFPVVNTLLDARMRRAFGYPEPPALLSALVRGSLWLRKQFLQVVTFHPTPKVPKNSLYRTYPKNDWMIEEVGPEKLLGALKRKGG
jgi:hypothetical protein